MFTEDGERAICRRCSATFVVHRGRTKIEGTVHGEKGSEVSAVVRSFMTGSAKQMNIEISNSQIGLFNAGQMREIEHISASVGSLNDHGQRDVGLALKRVTEALIASQELSTQQRSDMLELLEELSKQATLAPEARAKPGIIKSVLGGLASTLSAAGGLAEVWTACGPAIRAHFGL
ncbi:MAG: hypothetical protein U1D55_11160 [Phycisphaerae bacterium]